MTLSYLFKLNNLSKFNERRCCYATTQVHSTDADRKSKGFSLFSQQPLSALVKIKSLKSHHRMSFLVRRDSMTQSHCRAMNQLFMLAFCCTRHWVQFFIYFSIKGAGGESVLFRESYSCSRVYQPGFCWGIQRQQRVSAWACDAVIIIPIWRHKTRNGLHNYFFFSSTHDLLCCVEWRRQDVFVSRESHIMGWHRCQTSPTFQGSTVFFLADSSSWINQVCSCAHVASPNTDNCCLRPCIDTPWSVC